MNVEIRSPEAQVVSARDDARTAPDAPSPPLLEYLLRFADSDLVLAQRLAEWIGHGPILEEDIAQANVGLDLLGQARLWFAYASEVDALDGRRGRSEDQFAFLRDGAAFHNLLIVERPNGSYADTIARQFLFDQWHQLALNALSVSRDARIAEIAAKAAKEVAYHVERSADWMIRLGDGTAESHARMQSAIDELWTYTGEMFDVDSVEASLIAQGIAADVRALHAPWLDSVRAILGEAMLRVPSSTFMQGSGGRGGKQGRHSEHLGYLLADMQFLQRAYPNAEW